MGKPRCIERGARGLRARIELISKTGKHYSALRGFEPVASSVDRNCMGTAEDGACRLFFETPRLEVPSSLLTRSPAGVEINVITEPMNLSVVDADANYRFEQTHDIPNGRRDWARGTPCSYCDRIESDLAGPSCGEDALAYGLVKAFRYEEPAGRYEGAPLVKGLVHCPKGFTGWMPDSGTP
jgi:hypothetical protein